MLSYSSFRLRSTSARQVVDRVRSLPQNDRFLAPIFKGFNSPPQIHLDIQFLHHNIYIFFQVIVNRNTVLADFLLV